MKDTGERLIPDGHHQTLTYGEHLSRYLAVKDIVSGKTVLDVASGTGYGAKIIAQYAKKVHGVDYNHEAIDYSKKHFSAGNIEYQVGDALEIPLPDNSVDVVISFETIEHLSDPKRFIEEVKRVLKSEGQFVVSTPNDDEFIEGNEFHLHEFTLKELQKLIQKNFINSNFYYQGSYFSSAVLNEQVFGKGGKWEGPLEKTFGQNLNKAIYYLVVASNRPTEELVQTAVIADTWSTKSDIERETARRDEKRAMEAEIVRYREHSSKLEQELHKIKTSRGWRLLSRAYRVKHKLTHIKK